MHFFICVLSTINYFYIITRIKQISFQFLKIIIQECFEVVPRHESVFTNPLQLVQVAWKACTPILSCFCGGVQSRVFCYMPTLPAYCHSVVYISYICHFDMANANIRRHFREAELLRAVGMVQQGATYRQVGAAPSSPEPGRDTGYKVHPPGDMLEVGKGSQHQLRIRSLVVQARRARFLIATSLRNDLANALGFRVSTQPAGCMKVNCSREDLACISPCCDDIARPAWNGPGSMHGGPCNTGETFCSLMSPDNA